MNDCGGVGASMVLSQHPIPFLNRIPPFLLSTMTTKVCNVCHRELSLSAFGNHRHTKDGLAYRCKECGRRLGKIYSQTPTGIYVILKAVNKWKKRKPVLISQEDFVSWYESQPKQCAYCDIPEEIVMILPEHYKMNRHRLAIDSKTNDLGYVEGNMVLSCGRCNSLKSDVFNYEEFREIAQKYLKDKWMKLKEDADDI